MKDIILTAMAILSAAVAFADKLENGASFSLKALPAELVAQAPEGQSSGLQGEHRPLFSNLCVSATLR